MPLLGQEALKSGSHPDISESGPANALAQKEVDSRSLLGSERRIAIVHGGERYWLQSTRAGKLLLTK